MALRLDYSAWLLENDEIKRRFDYQDSNTRNNIATLFLDCKVEKGTIDTHTFLSFMFTPFRVIDGLDLGLSLTLVDGSRPRPVGAHVASADGGRGALLSPRTRQGMKLLLSHLLAGKELKFGVWQGPEQLVDMPLYNDPEFIVLHQDAVAKLLKKSRWAWSR